MRVLSKNRVELTSSPRQSFLLVGSARLEGKCRLERILLTMVWPSNGCGPRSGERCPSHPPRGHTTRRRLTQSTFQPQVWSLTHFYSAYSYLPNTTPWVIIKTGVGFPSLGFYYCPWFSLFPTLGYYSALGFLFFLPLATIQP